MKTILSYITVFFLLFTSCNKQEEKVSELILGNFTLNTEQLNPGQTIDIICTGTDTDAKSHYYYMVNTKSYPIDINFSENKIATITIPDSAHAVVFNFKVNGKYDNNNKKGYLIPLHNKDGNILSGSKAALANYTMTYGQDFGISVDKDQLFNDIKNDITSHPEIKDAWNSLYLNLAYRQDKTIGEGLINEYITSVASKNNLSEKDYISMSRLYNTIGKKELADSITKLTTTKFPNGKTVQNSYANKFSSEKDLAKKEAIFTEFKSKYKTSGNIGNYMIRSLAMEKYNNGNIDAFNSYANMLADKSAKAGLFNSIAWPLAEKGENLELAGNISKSSLDVMKELQANPDKKPDYYTESQYKSNLESSYNMYADTYALILFKQGNVKEAISYQEKAIGKGDNGELNERYIEFLIADKQFDVAQTKAENFIKEGHATSKTKTFFKEAYFVNNEDTNAFDAKLLELENIAHKNHVSEIKETMIEEDAPNFTLKDTEGENVTLASLKGKIVILDFWATWCGPCIASFPGMQKVVTKYKDDTDVVLLFVDTFERGKNREQLVTDFIAKNNYTFHVVYDAEIENSRDFEVAGKYGISGIPTKIIIDKNGKIRFKAVGYGGQTEKLADEMDVMIEILKS